MYEGLDFEPVHVRVLPQPFYLRIGFVYVSGTAFSKGI